MRAYPIIRVVVAHEDPLQCTLACRLFRQVDGVQCDVANATELEKLEPADVLVLGSNIERAVEVATGLRTLGWAGVIVRVGPGIEKTREMKSCRLHSLESLDEERISSLLETSSFQAPDPLEFAAHFRRANLDRAWWTTVVVARAVLGLRQTRGNKNAAAALLGLTPQHLRKILDEHHSEVLAIAIEFDVPRGWVELDSSRSGNHAIERHPVAKR